MDVLRFAVAFAILISTLSMSVHNNNNSYIIMGFALIYVWYQETRED